MEAEMMEIDQAVLENLMMVVPFGQWSPLLESAEGQAGFAQWCSTSPIAMHLMETALADAPVFELDDEESIFILSVNYAEAESLLQSRISAYEDQTLARLIGQSAAG
jgi:hypothetical protein